MRLLTSGSIPSSLSFHTVPMNPVKESNEKSERKAEKKKNDLPPVVLSDSTDSS
jgi:hypothetical protein